jgi:hypothetical protein
MVLYCSFSSVSGQLNDDKFLQAYDFLDKYQEDEVQKLQKALKKTKSPGRKEAIKEAFIKYVVQSGPSLQCRTTCLLSLVV